MKKSKKAFTMIELVFVIVVLGILAAVAMPKFAATRLDAQITKARSDVASIRSAIVTERQSRLIQGVSGFIPNGTGTYVATNGTAYDQMDRNGLFGGVLTYSVANTASTDGKWSGVAGAGTYQFRLKGANNTFTYNPTNATVTVNGVNVPAGGFSCTAGTYCSQLTD